MILPGSYIYCLILLAVSLLLVGSWANTFKWTGGKWRFELFYFDVALGAVLLAVIAALTLGSLGFDGFSFGDDIRLAGKRQDLFAFLAGGLFNAGNLLIVGAMSLTAMSVALPIGLSVGLLVGALADLAINRDANPLYIAGGVIALIAAVATLVIAWRRFAVARSAELVRQGKPKSARRSVSMKGVILSVLGGILIGAAQPLVGFARVPDVGLGPYSLGFVFAVGMLVSTFVLNLFFMNLPIAGEPVEMVVYFRARAAQHLPGILGGALLMAGVLASLTVVRGEGAASVPAGFAFAVTQGAVVPAMIWGLVAWKELAGTEANVRPSMGIALLLSAAGVALVSLGSQVAAH